MKTLLKSIDLRKFDVDSYKDEIIELLRDNLKGVIDGAKEDVQLFAEEITADVIRAAKLPEGQAKDKLLAELDGQIRSLVELNRIRVTQAKFELTVGIIKGTVKTLVKMFVPIPG